VLHKKKGIVPLQAQSPVNLEAQLLVNLTKMRDPILLPLKCGLPLGHGPRADQGDGDGNTNCRAH
jgi:hypothetical protein